MGLAFGPITQLYTRYLYALINSVPSFNSWVSITDEARNELLFWNGLSYESFTSPIWAPTIGNAVRLVRIASDASDRGWGAHTLSGPSDIAHEFFSAEECSESSTYRELLGVFRSLQSFIDRCRNSFVVYQVDSMNLLSIVNRGSRSEPINLVARDLYWYCLSNGITLQLEWVPRDQNQIADAISKMYVLDDYQLHPRYFHLLDQRWGPHSVDLFASSRTTHCTRFYSRHWCPGTSGINAFAYDWTHENPWINAPFRLIGYILRRLRDSLATATLILPVWWSAPWWHLLAPDSTHLADYVVDWLWLPRHDSGLFIPSQDARSPVQGRPPAWPVDRGTPLVRVVYSRYGTERSEVTYLAVHHPYQWCSD